MDDITLPDILRTIYIYALVREEQWHSAFMSTMHVYFTLDQLRDMVTIKLGSTKGPHRASRLP